MLVDIVIPVHNEAIALDQSIPRLHEHLRTSFPYRWQIVLVDHGSTDGSYWTGRKLEQEYPGVVALQIALTGRGRALKRASQLLGDVFCFLDALRMPGDLNEIAVLVKPVAEDDCDLAVGNRTPAGIVAGLYRLGLRLLLGLHVADAPFKAVNRRVATELVPQVRDEFWFFDTELLAIAQARGFRLQEVAISSENSGRSLEEPLADAMHRVLDLRRRLRGEARQQSQS